MFVTAAGGCGVGAFRLLFGSVFTDDDGCIAAAAVDNGVERLKEVKRCSKRDFVLWTIDEVGELRLRDDVC
jgi:hypothetical protein